MPLPSLQGIQSIQVYNSVTRYPVSNCRLKTRIHVRIHLYTMVVKWLVLDLKSTIQKTCFKPCSQVVPRAPHKVIVYLIVQFKLLKSYGQFDPMGQGDTRGIAL